MKSNTHDIQEMYLYFLSAMHVPLNACPLFITSYQPAVVGPNSLTEVNITSCNRIFGPSFRTVSRKNGADFWWHSDAKGGFAPPPKPPLMCAPETFMDFSVVTISTYVMFLKYALALSFLVNVDALHRFTCYYAYCLGLEPNISKCKHLIDTS
jgi:hypothetical protein